MLVMGNLLIRAIEQLELANQLLLEVFAAGLWSKSDDSSDNRRRRRTDVTSSAMSTSS